MDAIKSFKAETPSQPTRTVARAVSQSGIRRKGIRYLSLIGVVVLCLRLRAVVGHRESLLRSRNGERGKGQGTTWRPTSSSKETVSRNEGSEAREQGEPTDDEREVLIGNEHKAGNKFDEKTCQLTWRTKLKTLWTRVEKWWKRNTHPESQKCSDVKRRGGVPSVSAGHSPIDTFGYPFFDINSSRTILKPRIALSTVSGHMQPIRVGAEDYIIRGSLGEIVAFLDCFENYEVIASTVGPDGHWVSTPERSNIVLQVQNVSKGLSGPLELNERLLEAGVEGFTKLTGALRAEAITTLAAKINKVLDAVEHVESIEQLQDIPQLWNALLQCKEADEVVKNIWLFTKYTLGWQGLEKEKGWVDNKTVDLTGTLTLKISSYPQPSHQMRATLVMPVNKTTLKHIRKTLPDVFSTSTEHKENKKLPKTS